MKGVDNIKKRRLKKKFKVFFSLYFILLISYFTVYTFSKYAGTIEKQENVDIAKWNVSVDSDSNSSLDVVSGNLQDNLEEQSYILTVASTSDVASNYSIVITNVPDNIQVKVDNGDIISEENNEILIENVGSFNANDTNSTHSHTLTFIAPTGTHEISEQEISVDVIFTQKEL